MYQLTKALELLNEIEEEIITCGNPCDENVRLVSRLGRAIGYIESAIEYTSKKETQL